ncbi:hypothetical protein [Paenibacillus agilis]|nr:hypothetical protein [Paenibacillus agilis]
MDKWIGFITALTNLTIALINAWLIKQKLKELKTKDADRSSGQRPE